MTLSKEERDQLIRYRLDQSHVIYEEQQVTRLYEKMKEFIIVVEMLIFEQE